MPRGPKILVFSTNTISDAGIDLAGASHQDYPTGVVFIAVPCSSGVDPRWILYALKEACFDGVFIAADGTDCPYLTDCTKRTGEIMKKAQELLEAHQIDPRRLKMAAICSICADAFVNHVKKFAQLLEDLAHEER